MIPVLHRNPGNYVHPGDVQGLIAGNDAGAFDITFFGPGVKLICLRKPRAHPWIVGTSFHQSAGAELKKVEWDKRKAELKGEIHRPAGQSGYLTFTGLNGITPLVRLGPRSVHPRRAANNSWCASFVTEKAVTPFRICFK